MRLKLNLKTLDKTITHNYYYYLSAAIYKVLKLGSPEFSEFLHQNGYNIGQKKFKLFTFSLRFDKYSVEPDYIRILSRNARLIVSSPLFSKFFDNFVLGLFKLQSISIVSKTTRTNFIIDSVEKMDEPSFSNYEKFIPYTPLVLSKGISNTYNKLDHYYLRYYDNNDEIKSILNNNLISKYEIVYKKKYEGSGINLIWDKEYIMKNPQKNFTKKITIEKNSLEIPNDVVGNFLPFYLEGDPKLMEMGYFCGFGEKNSMGFGFTEKANLNN